MWYNGTDDGGKTYSMKTFKHMENYGNFASGSIKIPTSG